VDAVRAAQVPPEAPASPPGGELASEATPPAPKGSQWLVREGDTLYKACRVTYGSCDKKALQEIIAKNPEIGPDAKIYEGQVLFFPLQTEAATPN
jgi:hypothetical protein